MAIQLAYWCGVFSLVLCLAFIVAPAAPAAERADIRGMGQIRASSRFFGEGARRTSWVTFAARDAEHAKICGSKFMADLLEFGGITAHEGEGLPGTLLGLEGAGFWLLGLDRSRCHVLFARTREEMRPLARRAGARRWREVPSGAYPPWLDCFDNAAAGFYFLIFSVLPEDVNADFRWCREQRLTPCAVGTTETRYVAPGVIDTSIMDWYTALARTHEVPYRMALTWASPGRPPCTWNRAPLPHVIPGEPGIHHPTLGHVGCSMFNSFEPIPASDPYTLDFRRRVAEYVGTDPYFMGHHVSAEIPGAGILELVPVAGMPSTKEYWHRYLREELRYDLKEVGRRYRGDQWAVKSWADVDVPSPKDFVGWGRSALDLVGVWNAAPDRGKVGTRERWFTPEGAPADSQKLHCNDPIIMMYEVAGQKSADLWLWRTMKVTPRQRAELRYLHVSRASWHSNAGQVEVYLNGRKLEDQTVQHPLWGDMDQCFSAGAALRDGDNHLAINTHGYPIPSYVFLSAAGRWAYPSPDPLLNRLYYDGVNFSSWLRMRALEDSMCATRAGDPDRPMKVMAPWSHMDSVLDLCERYGAYPHDTGQGSDCWGPWMPRYAVPRGIPTSSEPGGIARNAAMLQQFMTFYLMLGNDACDVVAHPDHYRKTPDIARWIADNREMIRCVGKMKMVPPAVGVLRSTRATRLQAVGPWCWDIGRGLLQSVGRTFNYAETSDLTSGRIDTTFKVLFDDATEILAPEDVDALERFVRGGGVFVALHNTGMHSPERANAWPISRLTGLTVKNGGNAIGGKLRFTEEQSLWPTLRGREINGWGIVTDWRNQDVAGSPLGLEAAGGEIEVVAEWVNPPAGQGKIAVAARRIGKGMVLTFGSTFWRDARDANGAYRDGSGAQDVMDELLTSLGVPRDSRTGNAEVWAEHWLSKNGAFDLYPVARINTNASVPPVTVDVQLKREEPVRSVWDLSADGHPSRPVAFSDGWFGIEGVNLDAMRSRVYAAPRADIERSALSWFETMKQYWHKLPEVAVKDRPAAVGVPTDTLPLIEGWQMTSGEKDPAWAKPGFEPPSPWKTVKLGSFVALGLPEDTVAQFRKEVTLPKGWAGKRISLTFNADWWFWGLFPAGRLWIDGREVGVRAGVGGGYDSSASHGTNSYTLDVSDAASDGRLHLALEVDGGKTPWRCRPGGVTGAFYLQAVPEPVSETPLTRWSAATDVNRLVSVREGESRERVYLETRFELPARWPARRVFLESPVHLGWLILNDRVIGTPGWMRRLDVSGLVVRKGENVLRWRPERTDPPHFERAYDRAVPPLRIVWRP